jgi:protein-disulfide isomerase
MKIPFYNLAIFFLSVTLLASINLPKIAHTQIINNELNSSSLNVQQRKEVKDIIRKYLQKNPDVIIESIQKMRKQQEHQAKERSLKNLIIYKELILNDPTSPIAGNPEGDVTVVEFFDYSCGYCKRIFPHLKRLINEDKNIRFVFKELPILSPQSELAARAALAAWRQDKTKYIGIHSEFMKLNGRFSEVRILRIAKNKGLNLAQLKKDMGSLALDKAIAGNRQLAQKMNITGTPGFIIGNNIIPGAVELETLKKLIAKVRKANVAD